MNHPSPTNQAPNQLPKADWSSFLQAQERHMQRMKNDPLYKKKWQKIERRLDVRLFFQDSHTRKFLLRRLLSRLPFRRKGQ